MSWNGERPFLYADRKIRLEAATFYRQAPDKVIALFPSCAIS